MTREQVLSIFADATNEQITSLLNIHSADIGKAKAPATQLQSDNETLKQQLQEANNTIAELEKNKSDVNALQQQIDAYKAADAKRAEIKTDCVRACESRRRLRTITSMFLIRLETRLIIRGHRHH